MHKGKFVKRRGVATKTMIMILALVMIVGCTVGGTLAWLTDKTDAVTNTFTIGNIDITLTETWNTDSDGDGVNDSWSAKLIPGTSYTKNPVVAVVDGSEDCWLFVKFEETNSPKNYLDYASTLTADNDWIQGDNDNIPDNVWYREVKADAATKSWALLTGNTVSVLDTVTKDTMPAAENAPSLTYTAYAVQSANLTADEAWGKITTD